MVVLCACLALLLNLPDFISVQDLDDGTVVVSVVFCRRWLWLEIIDDSWLLLDGIVFRFAASAASFDF